VVGGGGRGGGLGQGREGKKKSAKDPNQVKKKRALNRIHISDLATN